ncbi:MAG: DUF1232 domain-containing protein [Clostridia bacterium]|nr:DUF1232 domain-containing protein [Clostridia bacterium]
MEEKFNKNVNPEGNPEVSKKSGMAWKIILMIILGILVLSPIDALPDVIPVVGWVDDVAYVAGMLGTAVGMLKGKRTQISGASGTQGYIPPMYNEVKSNRK